MSNLSRNPSGIPTGGQFAASTHAETDVALADEPTGFQPVELDLYELNDTLDGMAQDAGVDLGDDNLNDLTHAVNKAFAAAQVRAAAQADADQAEELLGRHVRSVEDVLTKPLSPTEIALRSDADGWVEGYIEMDPSDMVDGDLESHLDMIGERLVGSTLLMEPNIELVGIENGQIICKASGNASAAIDWFDDESRAEFESALSAVQGR